MPVAFAHARPILHHRRLVTAALSSCAALASPASAALPPLPEQTCGATPVATHLGAASNADFFTNHGAYVPRTHCMTTALGSPDWPWITTYIVLNALVCIGYLRIFLFWRKAYLAEAPRDRNRKLMDLAHIFLWCCVCGYGLSTVMFIWPAYRLVAVCLAVLAFFTFRFCIRLDEFRPSFSAHRLERELRDSLADRNRELERLVSERTAELEQARIEAEAANIAKSSFLANMSHEIRTPMTAICGFADTLCDGRLTDDERTANVAIIRRSCQSLLSMLDDVLDMSKIEAGAMSVERVPCDAVRIARDAVDLLSRRAADKGLDISAALDTPAPARILADPVRLRQILVNLLSNAIKFTAAGTVRLTISHRPAHDAADPILEFRIADTGIGMTPAQIDRAFHPFMQADESTTRRYGGTGLGLNIAKRLAMLLGGDVRAESEPGAGTTMIVTIAAPAAPDAHDATHAPGPLAADQDDPAHPVLPPSLRGLRILVVDDCPDNQRLFRHILSRAGAEIVTAADGRTAIDLLIPGRRSSDQFDLVVMDMQMPVMDGYEATRYIRASGITIPILALTAHTLRSDRDRMLAIGCDAYAAKPIDPARLVDFCRTLAVRSPRISTAA